MHNQLTSPQPSTLTLRVHAGTRVLARRTLTRAIHLDKVSAGGFGHLCDEQGWHPSGDDHSFDLQEKITTDLQPIHYL